MNAVLIQLSEPELQAISGCPGISQSPQINLEISLLSGTSGDERRLAEMKELLAEMNEFYLILEAQFLPII